MRVVIAVAMLVAACGGESTSTPPTADPDAGPPSPAADLFGLKVGARWRYIRNDGELRWKEITGCEDVEIPDIDGGPPRTVRAYVRENRDQFGLTSVHYLVVDDEGVHRVRRDEYDGNVYRTFATYDPSSPRLLDMRHQAGDRRDLEYRGAEWERITGRLLGVSDRTGIDEELGQVDVETFAGTFVAVGIQRRMTGFDPFDVRSHYVQDVGEVLEETTWQNRPFDIPEIEHLVEHTPGYGRCEPTNEVAPDCGAPSIRCDGPWGIGVAGCTDPRNDPDNCGGCGTTCASGVCAGGRCAEDECELDCSGSTICCADDAFGSFGCVHPTREAGHCGECGHVCLPGQVCVRGECVCPPGSDDCPDTPGCQYLLDDALNCGGCGVTCPTERPVCSSGVCLDSCTAAGLAPCGDECVSIWWDDDHCGDCDTTCGNGDGTAHCSGGRCLSCEEAGLTDCGGDCEDLDWADDHCGQCDRACPSDQVCVLGVCTAGDGSCATPCEEGDQICCDGICIDPQVNDHHCGGCGVDSCAGSCEEVCRNGQCVSDDCGDDD